MDENLLPRQASGSPSISSCYYNVLLCTVGLCSVSTAMPYMLQIIRILFCAVYNFCLFLTVSVVSIHVKRFYQDFYEKLSVACYCKTTFSINNSR